MFWDYKLLKPRKIKPDNPKFEWLEKQYPGFLHTIFMQGIQAGVYEMNKLYPFGFKTGYVFNSQNKQKNLELDWFWDLRDLVRVRQIFIKRAKKNLGFFKKVYSRWQKDCSDNLKVYQQADKINFSKLNNEELYQWYEKLYQANIKQGRTGYLADAFLSVGAEEWLTIFIKSCLSNKFDSNKAIAILTAPTIPSYVNEEAIALAKIKNSIKVKISSFADFWRYLKNHQNLWTALIRHTEKFYWVENNYFSKILKPQNFARRLYQQLKSERQDNLNEILSKNLCAKRNLLKNINNPWLTNVIKMTELMTHMQDYRKACLVRFSHYLTLIFREMARRTDLKLNDYYNLIFPEVADVFLQRKINRKKIASRIKENFAYGTPEGYLVYQGGDLRKYVNKKDFLPDLSDVLVIKGVSACPGLVIGKVKIIKDAHQLANLGKNTVLVTNNTTPEFVPLMRQAVAIVTEQGGITTHAAIVSRELGIPCVIGTKIATKVLKDGDKVEVDATKGVVKRL